MDMETDTRTHLQEAARAEFVAYTRWDDAKSRLDSAWRAYEVAPLDYMAEENYPFNELVDSRANAEAAFVNLNTARMALTVARRNLRKGAS